ncbi:lipoate-protein ligase [Seinonella peptonophila]|uniref:lipoate--protein ligase n=1 Tax=Seinonella peptonophila TaxID=112248 RepID=A0A1M4WHZ5_9BACL|nr:lipoate--protein ligase [Seinonella peptonophila]SHE80869.1 lipoate-protein ligase [Seinonella peptonophila]
MKFIDNQNINDPRINLAIEEYALRHLQTDDTFLLFYINQPSIIIGKHQNTVEEIHVDYVNENQIHVVRRLSGGGAVYHDLGNLNFSFITPDDGKSFANFRKFTEPVIEALHQLGVPAELSGRNDILVDGKKISGNAQFSSRGRMFSHGTLMFHVQLEDVAKALQVKQEKIESKGIKSVRSRVANIKDYLTISLDIHQFQQRLLHSIFGTDQAIPEYHLTAEDWKVINQISKERYQNWDWNYGESPEFNLQQSYRFSFGLVDVRLNVGEKGMIQSCKIYGDFFSPGEISELERHLIGVRYQRESLQQALSTIPFEHYFPNLSVDEFVKLVY